jgi:hypothetical protein
MSYKYDHNRSLPTAISDIRCMHGLPDHPDNDCIWHFTGLFADLLNGHPIDRPAAYSPQHLILRATASNRRSPI